MKECQTEHSLRLTEEEAMGLLDLVMLNPADLTVEQRSAVLKLSEFCREMLRDSATSGVLSSSARASMRVTCAA